MTSSVKCNLTIPTSDDPYGPRGFPQATVTVTQTQKRVLYGVLVVLVLWALISWRTELLVLNVAITAFYLLVTVYRVVLIDLSLRRSREIFVTAQELESPPDGEWPRYMIILPM